MDIPGGRGIQNIRVGLTTKLRAYFMRRPGTHLAPKLNQFDAAKDDILAILHPLSSPLCYDPRMGGFINRAERRYRKFVRRVDPSHLTERNP